MKINKLLEVIDNIKINIRILIVYHYLIYYKQKLNLHTNNNLHMY
jgi:hypothetical protein